MRSLVRVRVLERQFRLPIKKKNDMAVKFTVGTPNTLEKVWNIDFEREYKKLRYLFQNPERNNGIITESLRKLNMFIHQQCTTIMSSHASAKLTPLVDSLWIHSQKVDSLY